MKSRRIIPKRGTVKEIRRITGYAPLTIRVALLGNTNTAAQARVREVALELGGTYDNEE